MGKWFAMVGVLLGLSWPAVALAQFSAAGSADTTAGASVDTNVAGTGHPGKIAVGITSHGRGLVRRTSEMVPGPIAASLEGTGIGSLSGKYFVAPRLAVQLQVGVGKTSGTYFDQPLARTGKTEGSGLLVFGGPRLLYSAVRGESAELYLGGGVDMLYGDTLFDPEGANNAFGVSTTAWVFYIPIGFEFAFPGIPYVRLSAETSISFVTASFEWHEDTGANIEQEEYGSSWAILVGNPGLDFITLGVHYYF